MAGLYDFGPLGYVIKSNILSLWRSHFVQKERLLEIECSTLIPEHVLKLVWHAISLIIKYDRMICVQGLRTK